MERRFGLAGISEDESRKIFINGLETALKPYVLSKCPATWSGAEKLAIEGEHIYSIQEETIRETCEKVINKSCKNYLSRTDDHMHLSATHKLTGKRCSTRRQMTQCSSTHSQMSRCRITTGEETITEDGLTHNITIVQHETGETRDGTIGTPQDPYPEGFVCDRDVISATGSVTIFLTVSLI